MIERFPWAKLKNYSTFEELCLYLAEDIYPHLIFNKYLKSGNRQHGIDLIAYSNNNEFCIQCKYYDSTSLSKSDIDKAISEFVNGDLVGNTNTFIIATTCDLENPKIKKHIREKKEELHHSHSIEFDCWDVNFLETRLKKCYPIVLKYFGMNDADHFCLQLQKPNVNYEPVEKFINRTIYDIDFRNNYWIQSDSKQIEIKSVFLEDGLSPKKICLMADAHRGKSSLIQQLCYELNKETNTFIPFKIELKNYNVQSISALLDKVQSSWKTFPAKCVLIILDGLDEVPTDHFLETVKYIREFNEQYPVYNFLFSCRTVFFYSYDLRKKLPDFSFYELSSIKDNDIQNFLETELGYNKQSFDEYVSQHHLQEFLYQPFFLLSLSSIYKLQRSELPKDKVGVINKLLELSFSKNDRSLSKGRLLKEEIVTYKQHIKMLAFAFQIQEVNVISEEDMQVLFNANNIRELFKHSNILTIKDNLWSFSNSIFQEHLAAIILIDLEFDSIVELISTGKDIKKIKTKWIQTVASFLSIINPSDSKFNQILNLIDNDNIELLIFCDINKLTKELRLQIFNKTIDRLFNKHIRTSVVHELDIANFIRDIPETIDILISGIVDTDSETVKTTLWKILEGCRINNKNKIQEIKTLALKELNNIESDYLIRSILETSIKLKLYDFAFLELLLLNNLLAERHEFRQGVYQIIMNLELVDEYYQYALDGFVPLRQYNSEIHHSFSEVILENFLLSAKKPNSYKKLIDNLCEKEYFRTHRYRDAFNDKFFAKLFEVLIVQQKIDPTIVLFVVKFIKKEEHYTLWKHYLSIECFIENSNTNLIVVKLLLLNNPDSAWEIASLITEDCIDYLLFEFEEGNIQINLLRSIIAKLRGTKKDNIAQKTIELVQSATNGELYNKEEELAWQKDIELQNKKLENDIKYIQSQEQFLNAITEYFKIHGKEKVDEDELELDFNERSLIQDIDSHFVYFFLSFWASDNKYITLLKAKKIINNKKSFEFFRASEILNYNQQNRQQEVLIDILKAYYYQEIEKTNFTQTYIQNDTSISYQKIPKLLGDIFEKYNFHTKPEILTEMIWLDTSGYYSFHNAEINKHTTLSQKIIKQLDASSINILKRKIIRNMQLGIKCDSVLGTHIELCKQLTIYDSTEILLELIKQNSICNHEQYAAFVTYLELEGDVNELTTFLEKIDYNYHLYWEYIRHLNKHLPNIVSQALTKTFNSPNIEIKNRIEAAKYLAHNGKNEAFKFIIDDLKLQNIVPFSFQSGFKIWNVETAFALQELKDVIHLILDKELNKGSIADLPCNFLVEIIFGLASKSEEDLLLVEAFLTNAHDELKERHTNHGDINWYIERIFENYRNTSKPISITTVKSQLSKYCLV